MFQVCVCCQARELPRKRLEKQQVVGTRLIPMLKAMPRDAGDGSVGKVRATRHEDRSLIPAEPV